MSKQVQILNPKLVNVAKSQGSYLTNDEFNHLRELAVNARKELSTAIGAGEKPKMNYKEVVQAIRSTPVYNKYIDEFCAYLGNLYEKRQDLPKDTCLICGQLSPALSKYGICPNCRGSFFSSLQIRSVINNSDYTAPSKKVSSNCVLPRAARPYVCKACGKIGTMPSGLKDNFARGGGALNLCPECAAEAANLKMSEASFARYCKGGKKKIRRRSILENEEKMKCPRIERYITPNNHGIEPPLFPDIQDKQI